MQSALRIRGYPASIYDPRLALKAFIPADGHPVETGCAHLGLHIGCDSNGGLVFRVGLLHPMLWGLFLALSGAACGDRRGFPRPKRDIS